MHPFVCSLRLKGEPGENPHRYGERMKTTQTLGQEANQRPFCYEVTVLTTVPICHLAARKLLMMILSSFILMLHRSLNEPYTYIENYGLACIKKKREKKDNVSPATPTSPVPARFRSGKRDGSSE